MKKPDESPEERKSRVRKKLNGNGNGGGNEIEHEEVTDMIEIVLDTYRAKHKENVKKAKSAIRNSEHPKVADG